jgi:hypothetical protein
MWKERVRLTHEIRSDFFCMVKLCIVWMEFSYVVNLGASVPYKGGTESVISCCFLHIVLLCGIP